MSKVKVTIGIFTVLLDILTVTALWTLYTVHPLTDLNQTWYTVAIWQGLEAYLFWRSKVKVTIGLRIFSTVTTLWTLYIVNTFTDFQQT